MWHIQMRRWHWIEGQNDSFCIHGSLPSSPTLHPNINDSVLEACRIFVNVLELLNRWVSHSESVQVSILRIRSSFDPVHVCNLAWLPSEYGGKWKLRFNFEVC